MTLSFLFVCLFVFSRNDFKSDYKLSCRQILFRAKLKKEDCFKTLRRKESRPKL